MNRNISLTDYTFIKDVYHLQNKSLFNSVHCTTSFCIVLLIVPESNAFLTVCLVILAVQKLPGHISPLIAATHTLIMCSVTKTPTEQFVVEGNRLKASCALCPNVVSLNVEANVKKKKKKLLYLVAD